MPEKKQESFLSSLILGFLSFPFREPEVKADDCSAGGLYFTCRQTVWILCFGGRLEGTVVRGNKR